MLTSFKLDFVSRPVAAQFFSYGNNKIMEKVKKGKEIRKERAKGEISLTKETEWHHHTA
jgi:hypothetical protein